MTSIPMPKSRNEFICQQYGITPLRVPRGEVPMSDEYITGELKLDELTLHHILGYSGVDWMWLEHGYEPEDLKAIGEAEKTGDKVW
jgi:hypothetical protein